MKISELRELSNEELAGKMEDLREEMFNLRFQQVRNKLENPYRMRNIRRDIARILTLQTERTKAVQE